MKKIQYFIIALIGFLPVSCIVDLDLQEVPKDFLSPENSLQNQAGFEAAIAHVYLTVRTEMYASEKTIASSDLMGMDADFTAMGLGTNAYWEYFFWNTINKDNGQARKWWQRFYKLIFQTNVIIDRAESELVTWESEEAKNQIVAEARFVRAYAYHFLVNLFGDVPLVLHETSEPKFDYTRAPQQDVLQQCKDDLTFAIQWLKTVDRQQGGRAPRAAAYHLLSEIEICRANYQEAIDAASAVINDPNFYLMTERFGTRKNFTFSGYDYQGPQEPWGDVFWDLFQEGNMNWSEGNHEAIWNIEMDFKILGGGNTETYGSKFGMEEFWTPDWWRAVDVDGVNNLQKDTLCGMPNGQSRVTDYAGKLIWEYKADWDNDIRNSQYNIQRTFYWNNPVSKFYGQEITLDNIGDPYMFGRWINPSYKKGVTTVHYGVSTDPASGENHDGGGIFKDWYIMRLAETYLLRAEAYYRKGDNQSAANDINVIRKRAHCQYMVTADDVNLDLILDERARELIMEDFRISTLTRMGKLPEYLMKYNPVVIKNGYQLPDYLNKFPIPQSEIEANKGTKLEQNPGYDK
ncbi:hypothetical protein AGMMS50239_31920 [Bacteroidia bacterium]|nr:hypothetical protein AGMMS50239_31880 [Bacteroidia bacterium]GHT67899.1 hypothetical protein AGMMS50239_31920 [Bacteroidia bacterium]